MLWTKKIKLIFLGTAFLKFIYDDFKKSIIEILRGKPEMDGVILLGPNTNIDHKLKNYISKIPSLEPHTFAIYGNNKNPIPCDKIKISSNSIYLYAHKTKEQMLDVCENSSEKQLLTLFDTIDTPLYHIPWLDYNRAHFELIGNFYNFTIDQINSTVSALPAGSTLINVASTNHTLPHSIVEELILHPILFETDNPYIRFLNYILTNPGNNEFALNINGITKIFTSNVDSQTHFDDNALLLWQKEQIQNFVTFFQDNTSPYFRHKENVFYEFINGRLIEYETRNLKKYKELMLFKFIIQNSIEKTEALLLENNVNIDAVLHDQSTPLHVSVLLNNPQITSLLIQLKANINAIKDNQATPLILSSLNNFKKITELLLESGANVNAFDLNHNTALHISVFKGHLKIVELLLKFNANINSINNKLATPTMIAVATGNIDIIKLLLSYGPNLDTTNSIYENTTPAVQIEIKNYESDPVSYILKNNHDLLQSINALNNLKLPNHCNQAYNITELQEHLVEGDQCMSYIDLFQHCHIFNNEEYHY